MNVNNVLKALVNEALYTYEFDVTSGIVAEDIVDREGINITAALGLKAPCSFDEMIMRSFGDFLKCRYTSDSYIKELSSEALLHAYECGRRRLEANIYQTAVEQYVRLTYLLSCNPEDGHVLAYVICEDITDLEKGKGSSVDLDNRNLQMERDVLTRENKDLTEERDVLTREKHDLTEERDVLTREKHDLTEARDVLTREKQNLTEERDGLAEDKRNLTEERDGLAEDKRNLTEERDGLAEDKRNLTQERDGLAEDKRNLTEERDGLAEDKRNLTEERDGLAEDKRNLTEERDGLAEDKRNLTEERDGLAEDKRNLTEERDGLAEDKRNLTEERDGLAEDKRNLTEQRDILTEANMELTRASDAVHAMLKAGSYVCTYNLKDDEMLGIKYSQALRKLYGYTDENDFPNVWESWMNCIVPEEREYVENSYLEAVKDHTGHTTYDVTYRSRKKDGTIRWQRAAGYVMRSEDGAPITCYGLVMDVDEQKKAADKIEQALTKAQIASAAKTSFLARMSHDIRTPMNGILGLLEINENHADDQEFTSRNRKKMKVAANHLLSLLNDVLQLSKLEDPEVTLDHEAFNVKELAEDILTIIKMRAVEYGVNVEYDGYEESFLYPYIWGSPLHVRQIFINLFSNSIKYNKRGGRIYCKAETEKTDGVQVVYKVTISDTGIGMSEEFLSHLFEPFAREHGDINSGYEGTGLGMSIVKQLIEKMGGTIEVKSKLNEGSKFVIEIPFEIAKEEDIQKEELDAEQNNISGIHVLLVEDNDLNMEIAETFLKDAGAEVTKAFNGQQAVYMFSENPPDKFDVILMDVMMPVMNGYDAIRKIRSMNRADAKTIPIIAMTANAFVEDIQESKEAGMTEHISKPLDIDKVVAAICKYTITSVLG